MTVDHAEQRDPTPAADPARRSGGGVATGPAAAIRQENRRIRNENPVRPPDDTLPGAACGSEADPDAAHRAAERRRRRALFLRELKEARELRARVQPRKARATRMRQQMRMRTFRW